MTNTIKLAVNPYLPVRTAKDLVALGRSRPGDLIYASAGVGNVTHLGAEPAGTTPEQFAAFLKSETEKRLRVSKAAGVYQSQ